MNGMKERRELMVLADAGARKSGMEAATALMQLPIKAAEVLESMTDAPVLAYMAIGEEDVQALREFMLSRQGLNGLKRRHLQAGDA